MFPKTHLTSLSSMSGSRWMTTPLWLCGSLKIILYTYVSSCHLFLICSVSFSSLPFLSFIMPIFAWNSPLISPIFLNRSLVSYSIVFLYFSLHCSLKKAFWLFLLFSGTLRLVEGIFPFLPCLSRLFFSRLFVKPPQTSSLFSFISFSLGWF